MGSVVVVLRFQSTGSVVVMVNYSAELNCSAACGIFLDQESNPVSPALAGRFFNPREVPPTFSVCLYKKEKFGYRETYRENAI